MPDLQGRLQAHLGASHSIQSELGGGGMSRVFIAQDVALSRKVVVKVLNPALAATVSVARFQREILVVAKLNHPNIVPILTAGEVDGLPYFIMPYIEGESLRGRVVRGPLSLRETVAVLKDVSRALSYAHNAGIVHRDIKPDNILIAGTAAVVTDFGIAKAVSAARERGVTQPTERGHTITGVGISFGTPQYMAPEQAAADPNADARVDIYALGIVAYEMLIGSPPFHGRTPQALLAAQLTELPPPLASRRYDVPIALSDLIMKCLEKDPDDRPRSATELLRTLDSAEAISGPVAAPPQAAVLRRRRWRERLLYGLPAALVVALMAWEVWPDSPAVPPSATERRLVVRVAQADSIGAGAGQLAAAMSAAVETALVRSGVSVATNTGANAGSPDSATYIVRITVQRSGPRARAQVRLFSAKGDSSVWADQMDFRADDSFAAQDSVAARVTRAVRAATNRPVGS